jgi:hypothetical protein
VLCEVNAKIRHYSHQRTVLELNRKKDGCRRFHFVTVIGKFAQFGLNLLKMIMNALIVTLSVALQPIRILKKAVDVICNDDAGSLGWRPQMVIRDMVIKLGRIDEILPRGLVMLTITVGIDNNEETKFPAVIEETVETVVGVLVK